MQMNLLQFVCRKYSTSIRNPLFANWLYGASTFIIIQKARWQFKTRNEVQCHESLLPNFICQLRVLKAECLNCGGVVQNQQCLNTCRNFSFWSATATCSVHDGTDSAVAPIQGINLVWKLLRITEKEDEELKLLMEKYGELIYDDDDDVLLSRRPKKVGNIYIVNYWTMVKTVMVVLLILSI